jgi:ATP-binding cassette subfamily B multidrug efflux pump
MMLVENYRAIWPLVARYRRSLAAGLVFLVLTNVFTFLSPWILKAAIDDLQATIALPRLFLYCGLILGAALLQGYFRFAMRRTLISMSRHVEYHLRNQVFRHLLHLSSSFFQSMRTGDIMSRSTSDIEAVRMAIGPGVMHLANTTVTFLIAFFSMLVLHGPLTFVALLPSPIVAFLMYYSARFYHRRFLAVQEQRAWLNTAAQENFSGIRVIKAYNQEDFQRRRYSAGNEEYMRRNLSLARSLGFFHPLVGAVAGAGTLLVLWAGGRLVITGEISLGTLVAFMGFLSLLIWPTIALGWVVTLVQRGSAAMGRINAILDSRPDIGDCPSPESLEGVGSGAALEARDLSFTYPGRQEPVLREVSFAIGPGEKVALVGRTGSGKSTLLHLIPRLWKVDDGALFLDGHDINRLRLRDLRGQIGFVPQETFLFTESLEQNIALEEEEEETVPRIGIEEAARLARLTADISDFPKGYQTVVGERGVTLSGGQKQRTAIARALLRRPRLLILDDALSSVDALTEEQVLDGILTEDASRTVILVSHRLSTVRRAGRIIVLDGGRLVESGTHDELMRIPDGLYRHLVERQVLAEELEREGA